MSDWFETWFDSPYYHLLYENRNDEEARQFIDKLCSFLELPKGARVLDLACGKGRHSRHLYELGFDVTGVDLSEQSIDCASRFANERLHFIREDMRTFIMPGEFDVIFNLFTSFGYFDDRQDNLKMLGSIRDSLKPGGGLIIDFFNANKVTCEMIPEATIVRGDIEFHLTKEVNHGFIRKHIRFTDQGKTYNFTEQVQLFTESDFTEMLTVSGFKIKNVFGDYKLDKFALSSSPRMIIQAEKN